MLLVYHNSSATTINVSQSFVCISKIRNNSHLNRVHSKEKRGRGRGGGGEGGRRRGGGGGKSKIRRGGRMKIRQKVAEC